MARIPLACPIDGTRLGGVNEDVLGQLRGNAVVDDHMHLLVTFDLTCQQGHRWQASVDVVLVKA